MTLLRTDDTSARNAEDVARALGTDVDRGLSEGEAAARLQFVGHFADPLVYLLLAAAAAALVVWILEGGEGLPVDAIVIAAIVVADVAGIEDAEQVIAEARARAP